MTRRIFTNQMAGNCARLLVMSAVVLVSSASVSRVTVVDSPKLLYPYQLLTSSHFGRIPDSALPGSEVPVDSSVSHHTKDLEEREFLKLGLLADQLYNQSEKVKQPNKKEDAATPSEFSSLPHGVVWDINVVGRERSEGTLNREDEKMAFTVDSHFNVVVQNPKLFAETDEVEFVVVAVRQVTDQTFEAVSNPVAIVINIEHHGPKRKGAAVYVGVVVLVVCIFALLIPLTVRTKRRMSEGKPICACGSSQEKMEKRKREENGTRDDTSTVQTISGGEPNSTENFAVPLFGNRPRLDSDTPRHETLQHKNLRSESDPHFQPRWLDPHFKDVYERPQYTNAPSPSSHRTSAPSNGDAVAAVASTSGAASVVERL